MLHRIKIKFEILRSVSLCFLAATSTAHAEGNLKLIEKKIKSCSECHGDKGNSEIDTVPSIAGISVYYFKNTLELFKSGARPAKKQSRTGKADTDMKAIVNELDREEIERLAQYYSKQQFIRKKQQHDSVKAKKGGEIHQQYCERCHENAGRSAEDDAGLLAGQNTAYLRETMAQITSGERTLSKKMMSKIRKVEQRYGVEGFEALLHFYASQL